MAAFFPENSSDEYIRWLERRAWCLVCLVGFGSWMISYPSFKWNLMDKVYNTLPLLTLTLSRGRHPLN